MNKKSYIFIKKNFLKKDWDNRVQKLATVGYRINRVQGYATVGYRESRVQVVRQSGTATIWYK